MSAETWKPVVGYETRYEVSDLGRLRSLQFRSNGEPEFMTPTRTSRGYYVVTLGKERKQYRLHCLVLEAFIGPRPEGMQGCHGGDNKDNNTLENLRWDTPKGNIAERCHAAGEHNGRAKISDAQKASLIKKWRAGATQKSLAGEYGVSGVRVSQICRQSASL